MIINFKFNYSKSFLVNVLVKHEILADIYFLNKIIFQNTKFNHTAITFIDQEKRIIS